MAEGQQQQPGYGRAARVRGATKWANVNVSPIEHEDRLAVDEAETIWNEIYGLYRARDEGARAEVKLAVYAYYAANGASVQTKHSRDISTGGGIVVPAADVRHAIGGERLREFLRANVDDAYSALKESEILEADDVFVSKALAKGVPRSYVHCAADFLKGCSLMTPEEEVYAERAFNFSIQRARAARGGLTVEEQSDRGRRNKLEAGAETSRVSSDRRAVEEL